MLRVSYLDFNLIRDAKLTPVERAVLQIIHSWPEKCFMSAAQIGERIGRSARTVYRAVDSLVMKGLINKAYSYFKRIVLTMASKEQQERIKKHGFGKVVLCNLLKRKRKRPDMTSMSTPDMTSVSHSKQEEEKRIKNTNKVNFFSENVMPGTEKVNLDARKCDMIASLRAQYGI